MDAGRVGGLIAALRKEKGMTQQELADRLNVTNKAVSKWETGDGYPEITMLPPLADAIGVTVDELLRGERGTQKCSPDPGLLYVKFRNRNLISTALAVFGMLVFYSIQFTTLLRTWLGFGVFLFFLLLSITLSLIARNEMNTGRPNSGEDNGRKETAFPDEVGRLWVRSVYLWCAVTLLVLPYALIPSQSFIDYIHALPIFLIVGGLLVHQVIAHLYKGVGIDSVLRNPGTSDGIEGNVYRLFNLVSLCFGIALCGLGVLPLILSEPMPYFVIYREPYFLMTGIVLFISFSVVFVIKNSGRLNLPAFLLIGFRNLFVPCILAGGLASSVAFISGGLFYFSEIIGDDSASWMIDQINWPRLICSVLYAAALYGGLTVWIHRIRRGKPNRQT